MTENDQLYESQYGFRSQHSCDSAVGEVVSRIVKNLESGLTSVAIFLDLSKAFDTLKHELLLHKMERYGLCGTVLEWFNSYLSNRKIRVKCKLTSTGQTEISKEYSIEYGTPQGSCLRPLIFLIFCNNLRLHLQYLHSVQFADDTTLIIGHKNHVYLKYYIESDLEIVMDWFSANKLTLNLTKTNYMTFQTKTCAKTDLNLTLNGITLPKTECTKFLGTWLDDKLVWTEHVKKLKTKLACRLGLLKRSKKFLMTHAMKMLYYAQINSLISYGMWGPMVNHSLVNQVQALQDKAVKCIDLNLSRDAVYRTHKILAVDQMIKFEMCKLGYHLVNNLLLIQLSKALQTDHCDRSTLKTHQYDTRRRDVPNLPKATHSRYRNSYLFQALSIYSRLPLNITNQTSLKAFACKCKAILLE